MSSFESISPLPEDPILNLQVAFNADPRPHKINLGIGAYKDEAGRAVVLDAVRKAEAELFQRKLDKEYLPIEGERMFIDETIRLIFGEELFSVLRERIFGAQMIGGTSGLRICGEFFARHTNKRIFVSDPTWPNHLQVFTRSGLVVESYPYYDSSTKTVQFSALCEAVEKMPSESVILLHAVCHNPTGMDLTFAQWKELSQRIKKQKIIPFFDFAYQGFGAGLEEDAIPIRHFVCDGHEAVFVSSSFSKNMGLYGERVGGLFCLLNDSCIAAKVATHLKQTIRASYSSPPRHGAEVASTILKSPSLKQEWIEQLGQMRKRIHEMRNALAMGLLAKDPSMDFSFMRNQNGLFSYSGLNSEQVKQLKEKYAIYMPLNGRINVAGLNVTNLESVIDAIVSII